MKKVWKNSSLSERAKRLSGIASTEVKDRIGLRYGKLVAIAQEGKNKYGHYLWRCNCDCGGTTTVSGSQLTTGKTKSCGCYQREQASKAHITHGKTKSYEYVLLMKAKHRAYCKNLPFDISVYDIVIPDTCPILGIPLYKGTWYKNDNSPSIDRKNSSLGYTKDNIWVISRRANTIKNDATLAELKLLVNALEIV